MLKCSCVNCVYSKGSQGPIASIVTRLQAGWLRNCSLVPSGCKKCFSSVKCPDLCRRALSLLCKRYKGVFSPGLMWPGREADCSTPSSAKDKNVCGAYSSTLPYAFIECTGTTLLFTAQ
jgi:hypothetical protein